MTFNEWHNDMYSNKSNFNNDSIELEEEYKEWCYINGLSPIWS